MSDNFYTRPILSVRDVSSSVTYYCEKLGFEKSWDFGDLARLHRELQDRGAKITSPPLAVQRQDGVYQFDVEDIDGNVFLFWGDGD